MDDALDAEKTAALVLLFPHRPLNQGVRVSAAVICPLQYENDETTMYGDNKEIA